MSRGKKGGNLSPRMTLEDAAREAIGANMKRVLKFLPLATHQASDDLEYVHQLRVATRRTAIALRVFAPCIPKKQRSALKSALDRLRDAAGRARDWDVFHQTLSAWRDSTPSDHLPGADFLFGFSLGSRAACQHDLARLEDALGAEALEIVWKNAKVSMRVSKASASMSLPEFAQHEIARRLGPFEADVAGTLTPEGLHPFRIHVKRLRYTLEVFRDLFEKDSLKSLLSFLEDIQGLLGRLHDLQVGEQRIEEAAALVLRADEATQTRLAPGFEGVRQHLAENAKRLLVELDQCRSRGFIHHLTLKA